MNDHSKTEPSNAQFVVLPTVSAGVRAFAALGMLVAFVPLGDKEYLLAAVLFLASLFLYAVGELLGVTFAIEKNTRASAHALQGLLQHSTGAKTEAAATVRQEPSGAIAGAEDSALLTSTVLASEEERPLMAKDGITFDGEKYHYKTYPLRPLGACGWVRRERESACREARSTRLVKWDHDSRDVYVARAGCSNCGKASSAGEAGWEPFAVTSLIGTGGNQEDICPRRCTH